MPARRSPLSRLTAQQADADPPVEGPRRARARGAKRALPPKRPDARLVIGLVLVAVSGVLGMRLLADGRATVAAWTLTRDLPAGAVITGEDVRTVQVGSLGERYLAGDQPVIGLHLTRDVGAGEFLPSAAVASGPASAGQRLVTVPVDPVHMAPDLQRGQRVDLWHTPEVESVLAEPLLVLSGVTVARAPSAEDQGVAGSVGITLQVPEEQVGLVVSALRSGHVDLVLVPGGGDGA